jgi:hypothetical protein
MPHSPINLQRDTVRRHFTGSWKIFTGYATITDGINPSVYFQRELFFLGAIFVCKTIGNFFLLPTDLATEFGITEEQYADRHFPSAI